MSITRPDGAGVVASLLTVLVWQSGLVVQKGLTTQTNAGSLMVVQIGCACVVMWAVLLARSGPPPCQRQTGLNLLWGMMAPGLVLGFGIAGAARTDAISMALLWGLFPLLGPLLARLILREPLHWTFPLGALLGLGGLSVMLAGRAASGSTDWTGNALIMAAVLCSSLSSVLARYLNRGRDTWFQAATLQLSGSLLTGIIIVALTGWHPPALAEAGTVTSLAYLVVFMTIINYLAFNFSLSRLPVAWAGLISSVAPVVGVFMAWLLLEATVGWRDLLATGVIIAGVALPNLWRLAGAGRAA